MHEVFSQLEKKRAFEAAERVYTAEWRQMIAERYGAAPEIRFFVTPVVVDNTLGKTTLDATGQRYQPRRSEGPTRPRPTKGIPCLPIRCCGASAKAGLQPSR